jgi:hypothetical protein
MAPRCRRPKNFAHVTAVSKPNSPPASPLPAINRRTGQPGAKNVSPTIDRLAPASITPSRYLRGTRSLSQPAVRCTDTATTEPGRKIETACRRVMPAVSKTDTM